MYAYHILHTLRILPWEWIYRPYHEQVALFALIDEKLKNDEKAERKRKRQSANKPSKRSPRRPKRR